MAADFVRFAGWAWRRGVRAQQDSMMPSPRLRHEDPLPFDVDDQ